MSNNTEYWVVALQRSADAAGMLDEGLVGACLIQLPKMKKNDRTIV